MSKSKFKLEFTLKQHTPIIHFQSDQKGATLRATELKPKFDRFLIKKLGLTQIIQKNDKNVEVVKEEYKSWFIGQGKQHLALDYKVQIKAVGVKSESIDLQKKDHMGTPKFKRDGVSPDTEPFPTFFATMGNEWEKNKKYFNMAHKVEVSIHVLDQYLKQYIKDYFAHFMAYTNFGTRQGKGFGSFYLDPSDKINYVDPEKVFKYEKCWKFDINTNESMKSKVVNYYPLYGEMYSLFSKIELLYKTLRSGINIKNRDDKTVFYFKSLLHQYMIQNDAFDIWDKAVIKAKFLEGEVTKDKTVLSRDLLGLSMTHEYRKNNFIVRHPNKNDKKEYLENSVQRFKSPIVFKPVKTNTGFSVYIVHRPLDIYDQLINTEILLLKEVNKAVKDSVKIKLLSSNDFNLIEFLTNSFNVNTDEHILNYQRDNDDNYLNYKDKQNINLSNSIKSIFKSIKEVS